MEKMTLLQIVDKHIDQEELAKDLAAHYFIPFLKEKAAASESVVDDKVVDAIELIASKLLSK